MIRQTLNVVQSIPMKEKGFAQERKATLYDFGKIPNPYILQICNRKLPFRI